MSFFEEPGGNYTIQQQPADLRQGTVQRGDSEVQSHGEGGLPQVYIPHYGADGCLQYDCEESAAGFEQIRQQLFSQHMAMHALNASAPHVAYPAPLQMADLPQSYMQMERRDPSEYLSPLTLSNPPSAVEQSPISPFYPHYSPAQIEAPFVLVESQPSADTPSGIESPGSFYSNCSAADSMSSFSSAAYSLSGFDDIPEDSLPYSPQYMHSPSTPSPAEGGTNSPPCSPNGSSESKKKGSRRIWNHALEKYIFTPHELVTLGVPQRRPIYIASLEDHINKLHNQMLGQGFFPVSMDLYDRYKGLKVTKAKAMVAGVQHDIAALRMEILEIERATALGQAELEARKQHDLHAVRKYSLDSSMQHARM